MKKSETIDRYRDAYLEGKNEEQKASFFQKDEGRQYAAIMAWKRRLELKETGIPAITDIARNIRNAARDIARLDTLPEKDADRLLEEIDNLRRNVADFEAIKALRELRELEEHKLRLEQRMERLRAKAFGNNPEMP